MKFKKYYSIVVIISYLFLSLYGCTKTITAYRTETRPVEVTKYRTEKKPVEKKVDVPYQVEEKVPKYKKIVRSKINPGNNKMAITFFPFTFSNGNKEYAEFLLNKITKIIKNHSEFKSKYKVINDGTIKRILNKSNLSNLTPAEIKRITSYFNLETFITGHLKEKTGDNFSFKLEAIDTIKLMPKFINKYYGKLNNSLNKILNLFYGKTVRDGFVTKQVTKYKKELKTVYEDVEVPYIETEYRDFQVPYQKKVATETTNSVGGAIGTIIGKVLVYGLIILAVGANL